MILLIRGGKKFHSATANNQNVWNYIVPALEKDKNVLKTVFVKIVKIARVPTSLEIPLSKK